MNDSENMSGTWEDHFGVPWYIFIKHDKEHLAVYLYCRRPENKEEWSIDTEFETHILNPTGNSSHKSSAISTRYTKAIGYGRKEFMTWEKMKEEYLVNDELVVEIPVKITKMTGIEDFHVSESDDSFVLKNVFENVSKMKDTEECYGSMENHFGVPWCICIKNNEEHLGVYLGCERHENKKEWSIETEFEIHILYPNGNAAHKSSAISSCFTKATNYGRKEFMTWERMEEEFLLNDELVVEIHVKITNMEGIKGFYSSMSETVDTLSTFQYGIHRRPHSFVLKHVFKNVSTMDDEICYSSSEEHFGVPWSLSITHNQDHLGVHLHCYKYAKEKEWSIDTDFEIHVLHPNGNPAHKASSISYCFKKTFGYGWKNYMTWEKMKEEYLVNDELVVEIRVKITKMTGIKVYLRRFNDEARSDVTLVVNKKKFYVSKLLLASQSSFFESMLLGKFNESGKAEIELTDINEYNLQKYLEMLYGEDALDDETVEGILQLTEMYDTKTLVRRCEEYLSEVSRKTLKEKLEISVKFNLSELQKKCMSEIKTVDDVRSVIPEKIRDMDHNTLTDLLEKTLALK